MSASEFKPSRSKFRILLNQGSHSKDAGDTHFRNSKFYHKHLKRLDLIPVTTKHLISEVMVKNGRKLGWLACLFRLFRPRGCFRVGRLSVEKSAEQRPKI